MMRKMIYMALPLAMATLSSCGGGKKPAAAEENALSPADSLISVLADMEKGGKTIFGHHDDPVYGHSWKYDEGRSDVLETSGKYPGMMSWDLGRLELGDTVNLDGVPFDLMRREVLAQNARGGVNTFSWHLYSPGENVDSWNVSDTTIVHRMVNDPAVKALYREQLERLAAWFNSLKTPEGEKVAVVFRPWHEHTGGWFWWGAKNCSVEDYKGLWREMREVFDREGVDNVVWAYSPDRVVSEEQYLERYPGDEYVDVMGTDVYHFNGEEGLEAYKTDASRSLGIVRKLAGEHGKIAAFTETGLEGVVMPNWYSEVLLPILKENPVAYAVVWRNAHDKTEHFYVPFKGHPAEDDFKKFTNDSIIVMASK